MGKGFSGTTVKDTWTKPRGRVGLAGVRGSGKGKMETTVIE